MKRFWLPPNGHPPVGTTGLVAVKGVDSVEINMNLGRRLRLLPPDANGWREAQEEELRLPDDTEYAKDDDGSTRVTNKSTDDLIPTGRLLTPAPCDEFEEVEFEAPSRAGVRFRFALKDGAIVEVDASIIPAHWKE